MDLADVRDYCLAQPEATEDQPFGPDVLVFKVAGKMFALLSLDAIPPRVNLKVEPERGVELRERYEAVEPGRHMNKRHWVTVTLGGVPNGLLRELIDDSYRLVVAGLRKADRERLGRPA